MKNTNNSKDLLIFGHNYIGDVLIMTPAIRALKLKFPESRITVAVSKSASYVLRRNPDIWKIVEMKKTKGITGIVGIFRLFFALNAINRKDGRKFYACVNFLKSFKFSVLGFLLAEKQVGQEKRLNNIFLRDKIKLDKSLNNIDKSLKFVEPFYINPAGKYFNRDCIYEVKDIDVKNARNILKNSFNGYGNSISEENFKFILFSPGSTRKSKEAAPWLFSLFADYMNKKGFYVVITGSSGDSAISKKIYDKIENKHMNADLTGLTDIYTLGGLISRSSLVVSVDNGTMHLTASIKIPIIALFGSTDPAVCGPVVDNAFIIDKKIDCYHCFKRNCSKENSGINGYSDCMGNITPEDLIEGAKHFLNF
jgi:lipopolysaccharide heptosyltransferase II